MNLHGGSRAKEIEPLRERLRRWRRRVGCTAERYTRLAIHSRMMFIDEKPRAAVERSEREKLEPCDFISHELGEGTLKTWSSDFPKRYTASFVNARRRPLGRSEA